MLLGNHGCRQVTALRTKGAVEGPRAGGMLAGGGHSVSRYIVTLVIREWRISIVVRSEELHVVVVLACGFGHARWRMAQQAGSCAEKGDKSLTRLRIALSRL